jgi:hypothetical protein
MDFWIDISVAVLLRLLKDRRALNQYRPALLKVFRALADAFGADAEFQAVIQQSTDKTKVT